MSAGSQNLLIYILIPNENFSKQIVLKSCQNRAKIVFSPFINTSKTRFV